MSTTYRGYGKLILFGEHFVVYKVPSIDFSAHVGADSLLYDSHSRKKYNNRLVVTNVSFYARHPLWLVR